MGEPGVQRRAQYGSHRYDDDLLLKAPILLWLTMAFLVRHILLLGITFLPTTGEEIAFFRTLVRPEFLLADLPAAAVMLAGLRRRRPCPDWVRRIWRFGREVLSVSVVLYMALVARALSASGQPLRQAIDQPLLISLLLCLAAVAYLWRSPLVADVLRDCPGRLE